MAKLKQIQQIAISGTIRASITCGSESIASNTSALTSFLSPFPPKPPSFSRGQTPDFSRSIKTFYPLPYQVYYGALALP